MHDAVTTTAAKAKSIGEMIDSVIVTYGLDRDSIADEAGMHRSTFFRSLRRAAMPKPKVIAIVRAVNKIAMREVIAESHALKAAGHKPEPPPPDSPVIRSIAKNAAALPPSVQEDVLAMVQALHRKYKK